MKFKDYPYVRPNMEDVKKQFDQAIQKFENATAVEEQMEVFDEINQTRNHFETMASLCSVRQSIDTKDTFYEKEKEFFDEQGPIYSSFENRLGKVVVASNFIKELREHYGNRFFDAIEVELKTFNEIIIEDLQQENKLTTKYVKLLASAQIPFMDKVYNLSQMAPFTTNKDRSIRRQAETAVVNFFAEHESTLDDIYDQLVTIRTTIAKKLGFDNFVDLGYARMGRTDYNSEDVATYRKQVYEELVPIVADIMEAKRKRLGIDVLKSYDLGLNFLSGNPTPKGEEAYLVDVAKKMYSGMSEETKEFFDFMLEHELLELTAKPGKAGGGYCTYFADYKSPFIFSNFNGTSGDVDVLTHEAGHAFQVYSSRDFSIPEYRWPTLEACEIHSMSMEFFAWPWMEGFFKEDTDKYKYAHLAGTLTFIPYGVVIDEYQHRVYEKPEMTPEERKATFREIEKTYMPYKVYENEFLEKGTLWFRQSHVFEVPFYYIDYALAQVCAQQYWIKDRIDHERAWQSYLKLCKLGGSMTFVELIEEAGLNNPFKDGSIAPIAKELKAWLDAFDQKKLV